jgi:hypothetical protein
MNVTTCCCCSCVILQVDDANFKKLVAIIRIAVPYTGMILSTREAPQMRDELLQVRRASFCCLMFSGVRLWCVLLLCPAVLAVCSCLMLSSECVSTAEGSHTDAALMLVRATGTPVNSGAVYHFSHMAVYLGLIAGGHEPDERRQPH